MGVEDITYSSDFLKDVEIKVSYLINIPEKGILEKNDLKTCMQKGAENSSITLQYLGAW